MFFICFYYYRKISNIRLALVGIKIVDHSDAVGASPVLGYSASYIRDLTVTHCGLVMPYGNTNPGQHWLRKWLVAWCHQTITWSTVYLSLMGFCGIQPGSISQHVLMTLIPKMGLKITLLKLQPPLPEANELTYFPVFQGPLLLTWINFNHSMNK